MSKGGRRKGAGRPPHKLKAENTSVLDVAYLSRNGHLDSGNWKRLYWRQYGEVRLEALVKAFDDHITVDIGMTSHWIGLTQTQCNFGGIRRWFTCPRCGKRMGMLYFRRNYFACRHCQKIAYQSQSGNADDRIIWKYHTFRRKIANKKLQPTRNRSRIYNKFLEIARQYDAMLYQALQKIALLDMVFPIKTRPL